MIVPIRMMPSKPNGSQALCTSTTTAATAPANIVTQLSAKDRLVVSKSTTSPNSAPPHITMAGPKMSQLIGMFTARIRSAGTGR